MEKVRFRDLNWLLKLIIGIEIVRYVIVLVVAFVTFIIITFFPTFLE